MASQRGRRIFDHLPIGRRFHKESCLPSLTLTEHCLHAHSLLMHLLIHAVLFHISFCSRRLELWRPHDQPFTLSCLRLGIRPFGPKRFDSLASGTTMWEVASRIWKEVALSVRYLIIHVGMWTKSSWERSRYLESFRILSEGRVRRSS